MKRLWLGVGAAAVILASVATDEASARVGFGGGFRGGGFGGFRGGAIGFRGGAVGFRGGAVGFRAGGLARPGIGVGIGRGLAWRGGGAGVGAEDGVGAEGGDGLLPRASLPEWQLPLGAAPAMPGTASPGLTFVKPRTPITAGNAGDPCWHGTTRERECRSVERPLACVPSMIYSLKV